MGLFSWLNKRFFSKKCDVGIDSVIGEKCRVYERIDDNAGCGLVQIGNSIWSARGVCEGDVFEVGEELVVVAAEGVKLICKKN